MHGQFPRTKTLGAALYPGRCLVRRQALLERARCHHPPQRRARGRGRAGPGGVVKTDPADIPEPDRVPGAPHPRMTARVIGQDEAVRDFVEASRGGRLHHAWLLTGPRGIGKATLAWSIARWLLAGTDSDDLSVPGNAPAARRLAALSEPNLQLVRRPWDDKANRLRAEIPVEEIRRLLSFFHLSAAEGGRRIAIIDTADDMNTAAANALLKVLEEPPRDGLILMIAHQPARLLPTIRSRCRTLRLNPLKPDLMTEVLSDLGVDQDAVAADPECGRPLGGGGHFGDDVVHRAADFFATGVGHHAEGAVFAAAFHNGDKRRGAVGAGLRQVVEFLDLGETDVHKTSSLRQ
mgnify:CR=1 FL=1